LCAIFAEIASRNAGASVALSLYSQAGARTGLPWTVALEEKMKCLTPPLTAASISARDVAALLP
jgi:hypothetical protein